MPPSKRGHNLKPYHFQPGQSGNPSGRPAGARTRLNADFLSRLYEDYTRYGAKVIARVRRKDPAAYLRLVASLVPKQIDVTNPLEDLNDEALAAVIAYCRDQIEANRAN